MRTFLTWLKQRNSTADNPESAIRPDIVQSHDIDAVCKAMRYFVLEVRRVDGERYPPATIRSLLSKKNGFIYGGGGGQMQNTDGTKT